MSTTTTQWTLARWADRASATYVPIDRAINDVVIDAYGRRSDRSGFGSAAPRRPVKSETGEDAAYVMYDDDTDGAVPIIKIAEEAEV